METAGMSPYDIIETGTRNVGEYFANEDDFGTVATGKRADLVLVNANPLDNIRHLQQRSGVMVRGRWLSEKAIRDRLTEIEVSYRDGS
jgi:imidazolonepropionase-like amidohydrolase